MTPRIRLPIILSGLSTILVLITLVACYESWTFQRRALHVQGTVIVDRVEPPNHHYPTIQFVSRTGDTLRFEAGFASDTQEYHIGEQVDVLYVGSDPSGARLNTFSSLWLLPLVAGAFALTACVITGVYHYMAERSEGGIYGRRQALAEHHRQAQVHEHLSMRERALADMDPAEFRRSQEEFHARFHELEQKNTAVFRRINLVFLGIGAIMLLLAAWSAQERYLFTQAHTLVNARLVDMKMNGVYSYPLYEFVRPAGDTVRAFSNVGSTDNDSHIGDYATVYYDEQSATVESASFFGMYFVAIICGAIGVVFSGFGLLFRYLFGKEEVVA